MENMVGKWHPTKPENRPELAVEEVLCHNAYTNIGLQTPTTMAEHHTTMVTAMLDTAAIMCFMDRYVTGWMGIKRLNLPATTTRLVGVNRGKIKMDGAIFLNQTMANPTSRQIVTCLGENETTEEK